MVAVVAELRAKEGQEAELERVMKDLAEKTRANEPGCELYQLARHKQDARRYVVMERYADDAAFEAHSQSAHFKAAVPALLGCLDGAPKIDVFDDVA